MSIRAAIAAAVAVTIGLWLYTGYTSARRLDDVERQAAQVAARYQRAQDLLATIRTQLLVASVRIRDALLDTNADAVGRDRRSITEVYDSVLQALDEYVPVNGSDEERRDIVVLRRYVEEFRSTAMNALERTPSGSTAVIRELLNSRVVPRREAAVRVSEELQALNRAAFVQQQADTAAIYRTAGREGTRRVVWALMGSLGALMAAWLHAGHLERRLRTQVARSASLSEEVREVGAKLMRSQEDERRMVARELHDEVGQVLTAVQFELSLAQRDVESRGRSSAPLVEAQRVTAGAIRTVRDITQLLHPAVLDDLGLVAAVDAVARTLARRQDIDIAIHHDGLSGRLDRATEMAAYRVVQEAVTNIARHAKASQCRIALSALPTALVVEVTDNGVGFEVANVGSAKSGIGLIGVRERVARLGGTLSLVSGPGKGTQLHVTLPLAAAPEVCGV